MRRRIGSVLAWLLATVASILLATSAVGSVRDEVTNRPSPLRTTVATVGQSGIPSASATQAPATTVEQTTTEAPPTSAATSAQPTSTQAATSAAPEVTSSTTTTTSAAPTTTAPPPTTTAAPTTTTTTAAPDGEYFETHQLIGGWVRLRVAGDDVFLDGAVPAPGFSVEIKEDGPSSVVVEFESNTHESKLQAEVSDGELKVETEEDEDD